MTLDNHHICTHFGEKIQDAKRIVAIDTETAKNWRATEKFLPFCANFFSILYPMPGGEMKFGLDNLYFESETYFKSPTENTQSYLEKVDSILSKYLSDGIDTTFVGHQLSSDLCSLRNLSTNHLQSVSNLINGLQNRKKPGHSYPHVVDTRYDIKGRKLGEERLRCVSLRMSIIAVQNELNEKSLTKLYNEYVVDNDQLKMEKLIIMNMRHSFQTALVWMIDSIYNNIPLFDNELNLPLITTNKIIYKLFHGKIDYVDSEEYKETMKLTGISQYIEKYQPNHSILKELVGYEKCHC